MFGFLAIDCRTFAAPVGSGAPPVAPDPPHPDEAQAMKAAIDNAMSARVRLSEDRLSSVTVRPRDKGRGTPELPHQSRRGRARGQVGLDPGFDRGSSPEIRFSRP